MKQASRDVDKISIISDLEGDDDLLASRLDERFLATGRLVDLERERDLDLDRDEEDLSLTVSEGFTLGPPARLRSLA